MIDILTHDDLVKLAIKWLLKQNCGVVISEIMHGGSETPDAVGWRGSHAILIECKTSIVDLKNDRKKYFRRPGYGIGDNRYIMIPKGLLTSDKLFDKGKLFTGWGILEVSNNKVRRSRKSDSFYNRDCHDEISLLVSAMRRKDGCHAKIYEVSGKCKATITKVMESE